MTVAPLEIAGVRVDLGLSAPGMALPPRYARFAGGSGPARWSLEVCGPLGDAGVADLPPARHVVEREGRWRIPGGEDRGEVDPVTRRGQARGGGVLDTMLRAVVGATVVERGGLLVHGASVVVDGRAHLCPARSGSGKSTLARRTGHPLADELSILLPGANGWVAHATPWWVSEGGAAPLVGIYALAWGGEDVVRLPGPPLRHLLANMTLALDTPALRSRSLAAAAAIARTVPFHRLTFRPDSDVDALLRRGPR